jgi:hypothetical protein
MAMAAPLPLGEKDLTGSGPEKLGGPFGEELPSMKRNSNIPKRAVLLCMLMVGAFTLASEVAADTKAIEDSRDEEQIVDPVEATHSHHESLRGVLVHTVRMAEPWEDGDLLGINMNIWLPDQDREPDRYVVLGFNADRSMSVTVYNWSGGLRGHGNAWMVDDRTIRIEFARRLLGRRLSHYRWKLTVSFRCNAPEGTVCAPQRDLVPDRGKVLHDLQRRI